MDLESTLPKINYDEASEHENDNNNNINCNEEFLLYRNIVLTLA